MRRNVWQTEVAAARVAEEIMQIAFRHPKVIGAGALALAYAVVARESGLTDDSIIEGVQAALDEHKRLGFAKP